MLKIVKNNIIYRNSNSLYNLGKIKIWLWLLDFLKYGIWFKIYNELENMWLCELYVLL